MAINHEHAKNDHFMFGLDADNWETICKQFNITKKVLHNDIIL
jgi:hypothetical protein